MMAPSLTPFRVLLVDRLRVITDMLPHALADDPRVAQVHVLDDRTQRTLLRRVHGDVVVLHTRRPGDIDGVMRHIPRTERAQLPLIAYGLETIEDRLEAIERGARMAVLATVGTDSLVDVLDDVRRGAVDPERDQDGQALLQGALGRLQRGLSDLEDDEKTPPPALTPRQLEVLEVLHLSNKEIGAQLGIKESTVKNHVHGILDRWQLTTREEAMRIALLHGLIGPEHVLPALP
ncbi:MAG: LuxR C-terminal-related transcriptional regulator [Acidobacteriota bacterium]